MSAEKIIEQIKKDSQKEIKQILKEAEKQSTKIINAVKQEAEQESEKILSNGKRQSEHIKKILISKTNRDVKRKIMKARENIIEECFEKAHHKLTELSNNEYEKIVSRLINKGIKKIGEECTILAPRNIDKKVAEKLKVKVTGKTKATGGIIIKSSDGRITLDNTFEGVLKREKDQIRIKVGKLLFS